MDKEKELEKHMALMEKISNAKTLEELPSVTISKLTKYLASRSSFDGIKVPAKEFAGVVDARLAYGIFLNSHVADEYVEVLKKYYPEKEEQELREIYTNILKENKIERIMTEINARNSKIYEIKKEEFIKGHEEVMHQIGRAVDVKELPKVSRAKITNYILSILKEENLDEINKDSINKIVRLLIEVKGNVESDHLTTELYKICRAKYCFRSQEVYEIICTKLASDYKVSMLVKEVVAKEKRTLEIYKQEHDFVMESIHNATRISELPTNLSLSTLTSYLSGNTTIYPKAEPIPSNEFNNIANMLVKHYLMQDVGIIHELQDIASRYYPEKAEEAFRLLHAKLLKLPKIYYYAEEIRENKNRQEEFIARGGSNVFTYMVPNPKSPLDAGKFYNIYISRTRDLNLEEILPLDLDKIVPKGLDIDSIEWYVRENYDNTFKLAGGVIVNRDEEIGNVKIFKPSDGKIGVTIEEKTKLDELKELSEELKKTVQAQRQEMADKFSKMQEELLSSQEQLNDQFNIIEEKIKKLGTNEE